MDKFTVEKHDTLPYNTKRQELIKQIRSLQRLYADIGQDSSNIRTIFSLTLSFLEGRVNRLVVQSFFEVLMLDDKLSNSKELNLLNCFEDLVENLEERISANTQLEFNYRAAA